MNHDPANPCSGPASTAIAGSALRVALLAAGVLATAGCVSPYVGCVVPGTTYEPNGPPAAWVQRNVPVSPSPVDYTQRVGMPPPVVGSPGPVMELGTPTDPSGMPITTPPPGEWQPTPFVPPTPQAEAFPLQAPPAETSLVPVDCPADINPARLQSKIDELSAQITALDRRTQEQARALNAAQRDADTARLTTQRLETEFNTWRTELSQVRQAIQEQSHADLQALDELNTVLEQLVPESTPPEPHPFFEGGGHMATDPPQGARR